MNIMLSEESISAVIYGYHGDPFNVLGPHAVENGVIIRAFLPQAVSAAVVVEADKAQYEMDVIHESGLFGVFIKGADLPIDYQIMLQFASGESQLYEDPYNYPNKITDFDEYLLAEGTHDRIYDSLGAHETEINGRAGVQFVVWAPAALRVSVVGPFNDWDGRRHVMRFHHNSGIWDLFVPGLSQGHLYKYEVKTRQFDYTVLKTDPVGFFTELRPKNASIVWNLDNFQWKDQQWMQERKETNKQNSPMNVYEIHLGSWRRKANNEWLTYQELSQELIPYVKRMGYTHIELMPISEYPYDGSWGYQVTGYFATTSRYGTPDDFMSFVDACHQAGIGVILDWVPAHFPRDAHGLAYFDGTFLFEHQDPRQGEHPDWGTLIFNYGRNEVRQFLVSNALFWLDKYHIDGLRVDAVASMLYLDFSREEGQWIPNRYGGRENLEALDFIRHFNDRVHASFPDVLTIAEESTAWGGVTKPTTENGLGFDFKWNMGWMHDTLQYIGNEPIHRSFHHGTLTFSLLYAFSERFLLAFSHDEVVHLKKSMLDKMPGDVWQKFANLRALYAYQTAHPGKKMLFMGGEFGQWREWSEERSLDWHLLDEDDKHVRLQEFVKRLNQTYLKEVALYEEDYSWDGFDWLDLHDAQRSILAFSRIAPSTGETIYVACNFTPVPRENYRIGVSELGEYKEILNSDDQKFGGSGLINVNITASDYPWHDRPYSLEFTLPPLAVIYLKKKT
jgi:1,4-alpha-glucan branching enzyme